MTGVMSKDARYELLFKLFSGAAVFFIFLILVFIFGYIFLNGMPRLTLEFITDVPRQGFKAGGVFPAIFGTFALVFLMTIFVTPLGVATSIYLNEYARKNSLATKLVLQATYNLAGIPSIVFGLFGLGFFVGIVGSAMDSVLYGGTLTFGKPAILWASLTLALLTMPVVIVATIETINSIPRELRETAFALGATRWQVIRRVILPNAMSGIFTGAILAISRGAGEVAPILFVGAAYYLPYLPTHVNDQFMELGYHIYILSTQSPDVEATKPVLFSTVLVLLLLTMLLNAAAVIVRMMGRLRRKG